MDTASESSSPLKMPSGTNLDHSDIPKYEEPEDKGNVAYYLMLLFGIGALLPWNAILTALDFFSEKVRLCLFYNIFSWLDTILHLYLALQLTAVLLLFKSSSLSTAINSHTSQGYQEDSY
jgi:hypothetical protein